MQTQQNPTQHFFFSIEMMQVGLGEILARIATAIFGQGTKIVSIFRLRNFDISFIAKSLSMPTQSRRQNTIKHIEALLYRMTDVLRRPDSHQISWLINW